MSKARRPAPIAIDLCCGVGGMSLGFEQAGFKVVAAFDIEKRHVDTYNLNFPGQTAHVADLLTSTWESLSTAATLGTQKIDVVFGGTPCQGFSVCGRRDAADVRNSLVYHFIRFVREIQPKYFVLENVDGLMAPHAESVRESLLGRIRYAGYRLVRPIQILNAADFGVPQRRRRVFLIGYRAEQRRPTYPTPFKLKNEKGLEYVPTVLDAIGDLPEIEKHAYLLTQDVYNGKLGKGSHYARVLRGEVPDVYDCANPRRRNGGLSGCLRTSHSKAIVSRFRKTSEGRAELVSRYHRLKRDALAPALRAGTNVDRGSHTAARPIHPTRPRCITTREAARLHSYPDWFQFHETRWHAFRQIGNSVPPRLARFVAARLHTLL